MSQKESHLRSLLKAISWRVVATCTTIIISWFITGSVKFAVSIGVVELFSKLALYYLHERAWSRAKI